MRIEEKTEYTYIALDGERFTNKSACQDYERELPDHLWFCLSHKYTADALTKTAIYRVYSLSTWTETKYEAGGFLRTPGDYEVEHVDSSTLGFVGPCDLSDAVSWLVKHRKFSRGTDFHIESVKVDSLNERTTP